MGQTFAQQAAQQAGNAEVSDDGTTWWCRMFARMVGSFAGFFAIFLGIWTCFTIYPMCMAAGFIQMVCGFLVVCMEAPCLCMWFDFIEKLNTFSESRKYYQKAAVYGVFALIPMMMCFEFSTFFGSGCIFVSATVYGMMAFGAKADREIMMNAAGGGPPQQSVPQMTGDLESGNGHQQYGGGKTTTDYLPKMHSTYSTDAWDAGLIDNEKNTQQMERDSAAAPPQQQQQQDQFPFPYSS